MSRIDPNEPTRRDPVLDAPTEIDPQLAAEKSAVQTTAAPPLSKPFVREASGPPSSDAEPRKYYGSRGGGGKATFHHDGDQLAGRFELRGVGEHKGPLGQGSFGEVWQAYDRLFRREVALKILRQRMCRADTLLRFELEKQVIARMEHPNIARIFEAGTLEDGRPFLAMELLRGVTLTEYCEHHLLSLKNRLQVFVAICRAVQHAHERFVLHRDLKPSNILVVEHDGQAVPKVIDFGIAKVLEEGDFSPEAVASTVEGSIKGTPAYMSPEQTRRSDELTVRSDVYTLGAILFELLTADTPLSHQRTRRLDFFQLVGAICHEEPVAPSVAVTQRTPEALAKAFPAAVSPNALARSLRGDLDIIVLRALQKEPAQRYESAAALAADIERHLADEPIEARAPSLWYRVAKFSRRHRAPALAAALIVAALLVTAIVSTRSFYSVRSSLARERVALQASVSAEQIASQQRAEAEAARILAERKEFEARQSRDAAVLARGHAEDLLNYILFDLRQQLEPLGRSRLLASVSEKAEDYFSHQPVFPDSDLLERNRAVMYYNRGHILLAQGDVSRALTAFRSALAGMEQRLGSQGDPLRRLDTATASYGLSLAWRASSQPAKAQSLLEEMLPFLRSRHESRADPNASRLLAATLEQLGELRSQAGDQDTARELYEEEEHRLREIPGAPDARTQLALAVACEKVGGALLRGGQTGPAMAKFEEEVNLLRELSGQRPDDLSLRRHLAVGLEKLGQALHVAGRATEARKLLEERLQESELLLRIDPRRLEFRRDVAVAHQRLSSVLLALGDLRGARSHAQNDLDLSILLGKEYPFDPSVALDLACSECQFGYLLLKVPPSTPARRAEARGYLERSAQSLRQLAAEGKIDERGGLLLPELERALTDLH